jgi:putative methyltransferase (TIGR04325 family)
VTSRARDLARDLLPPALTRALVERSRVSLRFVDGFDSWAAATERAGAYSEGAILDQVQRATDEVIAGRAAFERDGVTFEQPEYRWPLAAAMLWRAALASGRLSVLDFGGSLGSSYRQLSRLLDGLDVSWGVVEQHGFVEAGRQYEDEHLRFFGTIAECTASIAPSVALLSGVLQYLPDPHAILREIAATGVDAIVIDRTPVTALDHDLPVVQEVPATIYEASYPAWLLSTDLLLADVPGWDLVADFPGIEDDQRTTSGLEFAWKGMLLTRSEP